MKKIKSKMKQEGWCVTCGQDIVPKLKRGKVIAWREDKPVDEGWNGINITGFGDCEEVLV